MKKDSMKIIALLCIALLIPGTLFAQDEAGRMVRLAKLVIDSAQLKSYNTFLREEIETSLRVEPGVLTLYAVSEKDRPTHITILEI